MSGKAFIPRDSLGAALDRLSKKIEVWVPAASEEGRWGVEFLPYRPGMRPVLDRQSTLSPKRVVFPQVETLLRFEYIKDPDDPAKVKFQLDDGQDVKPKFVFGARPCDVRGFFTFDRVFTEGPFVDGYYRNRRANTLFATLVCREEDAACFCSSVGSGPADQAGSDLWVTAVDGGYVVEALSERGREYVALLGDAPSELQEAAARKVQEEAAQQQVGDPELVKSAPSFRGRFEDLDYWRSMVSQCLGCGVCTYVCPTCYCFTITDEGKDLKGERLRSWDSCMFAQYTSEASGHNPRPSKLERYRNRVGHKFSYFPEKYDGMIACCGCGRCVRSCPVSIDIRKVVQELKEKANACA